MKMNKIILRMKNWLISHISFEGKFSWKRTTLATFAAIGVLITVLGIFLWVWNVLELQRYERETDLKSIVAISGKKSILRLRWEAYKTGREDQKAEMQQSVSQMLPSPSPTPDPVPEEIESVIKKGKSPGVFFPISEGVIINNNQPTIIAKIPGKAQYLQPKIVKEKSVISGDERMIFKYLPGRVQKLDVYLDGLLISPVFAVAQYPEVRCTPADALKSTDCLGPENGKYPDLLIFAKPNYILSMGKHVVKVVGRMETLDYGEMHFYIYPGYDYGEQKVIVSNSANSHYSIFRNDVCPQGWFYPVDVLKIPLPGSRNNNLIYQMSFPRKSGEKTSESTIAQIGFGDYRYNLFFPNYNDFYRINMGSGGYVADMEQLHLPVDNLYYPSGEKVMTVQKQTGAAVNSDRSKATWFTHFDMFTKDYSGGSYEDSIIPWSIGHDSGCDG